MLCEALALSGIPKMDQKVMNTMHISSGSGAGVPARLTWQSDGVTMALSSPYLLCLL